MATTTNYGWTTPDDTALVKDGAAAIRTLGSSVDTTTKALNPSTTLGDIEYRSATANTNTRLGIGTTGQVLTVNSGVPSWQTSASGGMTLISTTTLSGASVTLSSIPQTYIHLQLIIRDSLPAIDGNGICMQVNGDSGANRYSRVGWGASSGGSAAFDGTGWESLLFNMDNTVTKNLLLIDLYDYANATTWKHGTSHGINVDYTTTTNYVRNNGMLFYNQTPAITSLTLYLLAGNFTSGTVELYGVK